MRLLGLCFLPSASSLPGSKFASGWIPEFAIFSHTLWDTEDGMGLGLLNGNVGGRGRIDLKIFALLHFALSLTLHFALCKRQKTSDCMCMPHYLLCPTSLVVQVAALFPERSAAVVVRR